MLYKPENFSQNRNKQKIQDVFNDVFFSSFSVSFDYSGTSVDTEDTGPFYPGKQVTS